MRAPGIPCGHRQLNAGWPGIASSRAKPQAKPFDSIARPTSTGTRGVGANVPSGIVAGRVVMTATRRQSRSHLTGATCILCAAASSRSSRDARETMPGMVSCLSLSRSSGVWGPHGRIRAASPTAATSVAVDGIGFGVECRRNRRVAARGAATRRRRPAAWPLFCARAGKAQGTMGGGGQGPEEGGGERYCFHDNGPVIRLGERPGDDDAGSLVSTRRRQVQAPHRRLRRSGRLRFPAAGISCR